MTSANKEGIIARFPKQLVIVALTGNSIIPLRASNDVVATIPFDIGNTNKACLAEIKVITISATNTRYRHIIMAIGINHLNSTLHKAFPDQNRCIIGSCQNSIVTSTTIKFVCTMTSAN